VFFIGPGGSNGRLWGLSWDFDFKERWLAFQRIGSIEFYAYGGKSVGEIENIFLWLVLKELEPGEDVLAL
jgi:hypothetical protein